MDFSAPEATYIHHCTAKKNLLIIDMHEVEHELSRFYISASHCSLIIPGGSVSQDEIQIKRNELFMTAQFFKDTLLEKDGTSDPLSEYATQSPLYWYSRKGILYRMRNKAVRTNDLETLRPFIQ
jgi:hypothetical protein